MNIIGGTGRSAILLDNANAAFDEILAAIAKGRMFAAQQIVGASVGNLSVIEVRNPLASGKTLYFLFGDNSGGGGNNNVFVFDGTTIVPATAPINMLVGGPASVALHGQGNPAAVTGTPFMRSNAFAANGLWSMPGWFWCALPPNHNLQVQSAGTNVVLQANLRWIELST